MRKDKEIVDPGNRVKKGLQERSDQMGHLLLKGK